MVDIDFVRGIDPGSRYPGILRASNLHHRFAVIQQTDAPIFDDQYFDEKLWREVIRIVSDILNVESITFSLDMSDIGRREIPAPLFFGKWESIPPDDRDPPAAILGRTGHEHRFAIIREYWDRMGGPRPYSDSYTYSIFSNIDISNGVILALSDTASAWSLHLPPIEAGTLKQAEPNIQHVALGLAHATGRLWKAIIGGSRR